MWSKAVGAGVIAGAGLLRSAADGDGGLARAALRHVRRIEDALARRIGDDVSKDVDLGGSGVGVVVDLVRPEPEPAPEPEPEAAGQAEPAEAVRPALRVVSSPPASADVGRRPQHPSVAPVATGTITAWCDDEVLALGLRRVGGVRYVDAQTPAKGRVDIVVAANPSLVEQAMRDGFPVVAIDSHDVRELVPEGAGLVVPPHDATAVAEAIDRIAHLSAAGRRVMGRVGSNYVAALRQAEQPQPQQHPVTDVI